MSAKAAGTPRRLLLVGMMGAGKTTVGHDLAQRLGWPYLDSDVEVERATGRAVPAILEQDGEAAFRAAEAAVLRQALARRGPAVVSVAGGAVLDPDSRALIGSSGLVVWLRADVATLAQRVGDGHGRPLLGSDPAGSLASLYEARRPLYAALADVVIDVDDLEGTEVVNRVLEAAGLAGSARCASVTVDLGERRYEVLVGPGARRSLPAVVEGALGRLQGAAVAEHAAVVTHASLEKQPWFAEIDPGLPTSVHRLGEGEGAKTPEAAAALCRSFAQAGLSRHDLVVAVGGGVVTDVAGFAAATYLRGVRYVSVATTLLGQVDAAIGGKTGVNLPEGKNLVGAFWQPLGVVCDMEVLGTLSEREWRCGRGELAKYALLVDGSARRGFLDAPLEEQVARAVAFKAAVVADDEREGGRRAVLNYGHTLAHALEAQALTAPLPGGDLRHGEAVAIGLVFAARLAHRLKRVGEEVVAEHLEVVEHFGLDGQLPEGADPERLVAYMGRDKKAHHDLTFVLAGPAGVEPVHHVDPDDVLATLAEMGAGRHAAARGG